MRSSANEPSPVRSRGSSTRLIRAPTIFGRSPGASVSVVGIAVLLETCGSGAANAIPRGTHGRDDMDVPRAAAQIARERVTDFVVGFQRIFLQNIGARHQHSGRAEAAMESVMIPECLLHNTEAIGSAETLYRSN